MVKPYRRSGGLGDVLYLRAGLELVGPASLRTAGTIVEAQWAMPPGVTLCDTIPQEVEEDLDPLYEMHPLRLAVDRVSLGELRLTGEITDRKLTGFEMPVAARQWATQALAPLDGPFVAVVDSSYGEHRHLPPKWVEQVCVNLREAGYYPLVLGAKTGVTNDLAANLRFAKKTTLTQAAAILEQCAALFCVDTGLSALAGWLGVPQACIFQSQPPWCRVTRLPGLFTGFFCAARNGMPASYGGDLPQGAMPPAETVTEALLALMAGASLGRYWYGRYFDHAVAVAGYAPAAGLDATCDGWLADAYYRARLDGMAGEWDLHRAIAALEEQQVAVATSGAVTVARTEDLQVTPWLLDKPVRPAEEPLRSLLTLDPSDTRADHLRQAALEVREVPGDVAEVGVYTGGITRMLALMLPAKTVYGFDTFRGLPQLPRHTLDFHREGEFEANVAEVTAYLPATAKGLEKHKFALVHLDSDLYETTRAGLAFFWPRLSEGGVIVLDDYGWRDTLGVTLAVDEFLRTMPSAALKITTPSQAVLRRVETEWITVRGLRYVSGDSCDHPELGTCKRGEFRTATAEQCKRIGASRHFEAVEEEREIKKAHIEKEWYNTSNNLYEELGGAK
jgi:O-methyltransferase